MGIFRGGKDARARPGKTLAQKKFFFKMSEDAWDGISNVLWGGEGGLRILIFFFFQGVGGGFKRGKVSFSS